MGNNLARPIPCLSGVPYGRHLIVIWRRGTRMKVAALSARRLSRTESGDKEFFRQPQRWEKRLRPPPETKVPGNAKRLPLRAPTLCPPRTHDRVRLPQTAERSR